MLEIQGNVQKQHVANTSENKVANFVNQAKVKALEIKDTFSKSDGNTKGKINSALAGVAALGTVSTLIGTTGKKVVVENLKESTKSTFKKQNAPLKWLGAAVSILSTVAIAALNINFNNTKQKQEAAISGENSTPANV